jgi:hypothetical protein
MKTLKAGANETGLQKHVRRWLNRTGENYDRGWKGAYDDLATGGCISGMVSHLVYYHDTLRFYRRHKQEITALLSQALSDSGLKCASELFKGWDSDDPLALDTPNQNFLAWFAFEETARNLVTNAGYQP